MTKTGLVARCTLALLFFAFCLPLTALAGVMDDAHGPWKLDVEKTTQVNGGPVSAPFDVIFIDKDSNLFIMKDSVSGVGGPMPFTVQKASDSDAVLQLSGSHSMRLEMKGQNEMSLTGQTDGKDQDKEILYFTR